jgi:hypothetical protein
VQNFTPDNLQSDMHLVLIRLASIHMIMQSIFSVAARRRKLLGDIADAERRAGALKMD